MTEAMRSSRPYLLRAMNEWISDSGMTPHVLVDASQPGVEVPEGTIRDGRVVLNIGAGAVRDLMIADELITFVARFGGVSQAVSVPVGAVQAIYARENGRGMLFADEDDDVSQGEGTESGASSSEDDAGQRKQPHLTVVK